MKVTPFEGLYRYHVSSEAVRGKTVTEYLVDLQCYWGNGACGCYDFTYRKQPIVALGKEAAMLAVHSTVWPTDTLRCKHILAASAHLGRELANNAAVLASRMPKSMDEP